MPHIDTPDELPALVRSALGLPDRLNRPEALAFERVLEARREAAGASWVGLARAIGLADNSLSAPRTYHAWALKLATALADSLDFTAELDAILGQLGDRFEFKDRTGATWRIERIDAPDRTTL